MSDTIPLPEAAEIILKCLECMDGTVSEADARATIVAIKTLAQNEPNDAPTVPGGDTPEGFSKILRQYGLNDYADRIDAALHRLGVLQRPQ